MIATSTKKINHSILCITDVYLTDITKTFFKKKQQQQKTVNVSRLSVCSSLLFLLFVCFFLNSCCYTAFLAVPFDTALIVTALLLVHLSLLSSLFLLLFVFFHTLQHTQACARAHTHTHTTHAHTTHTHTHSRARAPHLFF